MSFTRLLSAGILSLSVMGLVIACGPKTRKTHTRIAGPKNVKPFITPAKPQTNETVKETIQDDSTTTDSDSKPGASLTTKKDVDISIEEINVDLQNFKLVVKQGDEIVDLNLPNDLNIDEFASAQDFTGKIDLISNNDLFVGTLNVNEEFQNLVTLNLKKIINEKELAQVEIKVLQNTETIKTTIENATSDNFTKLNQFLNNKVAVTQLIEFSSNKTRTYLNYVIFDNDNRAIMQMSSVVDFIESVSSLDSNASLQILTQDKDEKALLELIKSQVWLSSKSIADSRYENLIVKLNLGEVSNIFLHTFIDSINPHLEEVKVGAKINTENIVEPKNFGNQSKIQSDLTQKIDKTIEDNMNRLLSNQGQSDGSTSNTAAP